MVTVPDAEGYDPVHETSRPVTVPEKIVPFDVIRNTTVINGNSGVWDLMSYCPTRWTHAERWEMLFDKIGG